MISGSECPSPNAVRGAGFSEILLGFDARRVSGEVASPWDADRCARFLLRRRVRFPLSVDVLVWPSLFDFGVGSGLPAADRRAAFLDGPAAPPEFAALGVWTDLVALRAATVAALAREPCSVWLVGIGRIYASAGMVAADP
jgi:hypothetical protein